MYFFIYIAYLKYFIINFFFPKYEVSLYDFIILAKTLKVMKKCSKWIFDFQQLSFIRDINLFSANVTLREGEDLLGGLGGGEGVSRYWRNKTWTVGLKGAIYPPMEGKQVPVSGAAESCLQSKTTPSPLLFPDNTSTPNSKCRLLMVQANPWRRNIFQRKRYGWNQLWRFVNSI